MNCPFKSTVWCEYLFYHCLSTSVSMRRSRYFVQHLLYLHLTFCWMLRLQCIYNRGISRHFCHCVSSLKWRRSARAGKSPVPLFTAPTIWSRPPVRGSFKGQCGSWCRQIKKGVFSGACTFHPTLFRKALVDLQRKIFFYTQAWQVYKNLMFCCEQIDPTESIN